MYELWPQTLNRKPNLWGACVVREFQKLGDLTSTDSEPEASAFKVPQKAVREREREARRGEVQEERAPGRDGGQIKSASYCRDAVFYIGRKNLAAPLHIPSCEQPACRQSEVSKLRQQHFFRQPGSTTKTPRGKT